MQSSYKFLEVFTDLLIGRYMIDNRSNMLGLPIAKQTFLDQRKAAIGHFEHFSSGWIIRVAKVLVSFPLSNDIPIGHSTVGTTHAIGFRGKA